LKKIALIHLLPLEYYPPVTNLLSIINKDTSLSVRVFSTHNNKNRQEFHLEDVKIFRYMYPAYASNLILKICFFLKLAILPLYELIRFRPDIIFYIEPHSAFPAYLYKRFINSRVKLFIHYHEYYTPEEFHGPSMGSVRYFHKKEIDFLYHKAEWISQTNTNRLDFFSNDFPWVPKSKLFTLANYPPKSWSKKLKNKTMAIAPFKLLYIGALSFENTYVREIVAFVQKNPNMLHLDIFSYNMHKDVLTWLESLKIKNIKLNQLGVAYDTIPKIASNYDLGLVLYKGHNTNYQYNAPNKLFEYLVCGLDVWVPNVLKGCKPYLNKDARPFVLEVNYNKLSMADLNGVIEKREIAERYIPYNAEDEVFQLLKQMKC
jgi:hypothetical protein